MATATSGKEIPQEVPKDSPQIATSQTKSKTPSGEIPEELRMINNSDRCARFKLNPCFCCDLRRGLIIMGIFGIVLHLLIIVFVGLYMADICPELYYILGGLSLYWLIFLAVVLVAGLSFAVVLILGTVRLRNQKSELMVLQIAFYGHCFVLPMYFIVAVVAIIEDIKDSAPLGLILGRSMITILYLFICAYVIYVIWAYIKKLKRTQQVMELLNSKFPVGPPPSQQSSYLSSSPNVNNSEATIVGQGDP